MNKGDFVVNEVIKHIPKDTGKWHLYRIKKPHGLDTMSLKIMLLRKIPDKYVNFYGLKDKYAIATQYVAVHRKYSGVFIELLEERNISLKMIGYIDEPYLLRKLLEGNYFQLTIYHPPEENYLKYVLNISTKKGIPNYYGYQRFGIFRVNHIIGKAIILGHHFLDSLSESLYKQVSKAIDINILYDKKELYRKANRQIIRFFIHSLQSYLLNKALSLRIYLIGDLTQHKKTDFCLEYIPTLNRWMVSHCGNVPPNNNGGLLIPIIGYDYLRISSNDSFRDIYLSLLEEEGLPKEVFKQLAKRKIYVRGGFRKALMKLVNPKYLYNNSKLTLFFKLDMGSYATVFLRELIKPFSPSNQGF